MDRQVVVGIFAGLVLAGAAAAGWHYRAHFLEEKDVQAVSPEASAQPDVLYKWVDKHGVTHYSQEPAARKTERMEFDGKRLTPLEPVDASLMTRLSRITEEPEEDKPQGSQMLHNLRKELQENQQRMQEAKAAMTNDL